MLPLDNVKLAAKYENWPESVSEVPTLSSEQPPITSSLLAVVAAPKLWLQSVVVFSLSNVSVAGARANNNSG
jgi:hypothetical protein